MIKKKYNYKKDKKYLDLFIIFIILFYTLKFNVNKKKKNRK